MAPVNIAESGEKVVEINHHLVHLDSYRGQRVHSPSWPSPREFFSNLLHQHGHQSHENRDGHLYATDNYSSSPTLLNGNEKDLYYVSTPGSGSYHHHESNDTRTTHELGHSGFSSSSPFLDDPEEESLIVVYALLLPLLITLIFILVIALYVRRMRRSTSMLEVDRSHERYDLPMSHIPVKPERGIKLHIPVTKSTSFTSHLPPTSNPTFPIVPPEAPPRRSKKKKPTKYIHRSLSALGISSDRKGGQEESVMYNPYACYYSAEPGKRWNTSGFLNSTGSLNIHSDEASSSSDQEQDDRETVSMKDSDSSSNASSDGGPVLAIDIVSGEKEQKRADRHRRHHRHHHHHVHKDKNSYVIDIEDGSGPIPVVVEENYYRIEAMLQAMSEEEEMNSKRSGSSLTSKKSFKQLGGKIIDIVNIPKRIKQNSKEKKRFNVYTIPVETREQLKQIYVY